MSAKVQHVPPQRLLIVMPSWIGDAVMAMPALRAIRRLYPEARITALVRPSIKPIVDSCPWVDRLVSNRRPRRARNDHRTASTFNLARRLSGGKFDAAILLTNSFRSALLVRMAGIKRRIGYDRDGRGSMLTDRLLPRRVLGGYVPVSTLEYYLGIARYLGAVDPDPTMQLFTRPDQDARADELLRKAGWDANSGRKLVLISPGANYGDAKIWYPERFAAVADRCASEFDAVVAMNVSPRERLIGDRVHAAARHGLIDLANIGVDLWLLKSVIKRCHVVITNDTGPRHVAAALNVPVVSIFGPTDPAWTQINFELERQVMVKVFCGPCQKKACPLHHTPEEHQCMTLIEPAMVFDRAVELVQLRTRATSPSVSQSQ